MKKEICKAVAAVLAVTMTVSVIAACGRGGKEPADSLIASETYSEATVPAPAQDELDALIQDALGDAQWSGDYTKLTDKQKNAIEKNLARQGYSAKVTDKGIAYFGYSPKATDEEIAQAVKTVLGEKAWDGKYDSLTDEEKLAVRDALRKQGYDVELGDHSFRFPDAADRKEETTHYHYDRMPTKEQIAGAVADVIGTDAYLKWKGDMLALTEQQRKDVLKGLNNLGFDLALNDKGEFYMVHNPANKVTFATAYTSIVENGTTMPETTVATTAPEKPTENVTGTTADKKTAAPAAERTALSTFGGTGGDAFRHVALCQDGGYIVTGQYLSEDGDYAGSNKTWQRLRASVVRYDKNGAYQWKSTIGGSALNAYIGVMLNQSTELSDGSIVTVGITDARSFGVVKNDPSDALIIKYSKTGSQEWVKRFAGTDEDTFVSVCATPDGGFVAGGRSTSSDGDMAGSQIETIKALLVKYTADGEIEWKRTLTGGTNSASFVSLAVTEAGAIYAACDARVALGRKMQLDMLSFAGYGGTDAIIFKFGPTGELLTHRTIAGSGNDEVTSLALADGGVIVGGSFTDNVREDSVFAGQHNYGESDAFLVKLDAHLGVEWVKTFGGIANDTITDVARIRGGYAAVGWSLSSNSAFDFLGSGGGDAFVLTLSDNGSETNKYAIKGTERDQASAIAADGGKRFAVVGNTMSSTVDFSSCLPASEGLAVSFIALYGVK